jgi:hypothetical protein
MLNEKPHLTVIKNTLLQGNTAKNQKNSTEAYFIKKYLALPKWKQTVINGAITTIENVEV